MGAYNRKDRISWGANPTGSVSIHEQGEKSQVESEVRLFDVHSMTKMAVCVAMLCISAYISFQVPFASAYITILTMTMNLTGFLLTPRQTFLVILLYIALGVAGLPVLGGGEAGPGVIFGPRGGFYIGFLVAYPLVSLWKGAEVSFRRYAWTAVLVSIPITYIGGVLSVMAFAQLTLVQAVMVAALPFIPGDIVKAVAAAWLGARLNRILGQ